MKTTPPWSRRRATQPASTTCSPACAARSVPASWVRIIEPCPSRSFPRRSSLQAPVGSRLWRQARQERIGPAFGADGRLRPVPGQHDGLVRQGQADPRQAAQDRGVVPAGQVCPPDRTGEQQVTREQYAAWAVPITGRRGVRSFRGADFAFTLCAIRWVQWQPECHRSFGVPGRMVHYDLEPDQAQSHPVGQFFYVIGFGEFQAAKQLLPRAEREALGRIAEQYAVVRVDEGGYALGPAYRGDRPD